jgi:transglutaminase-like putative cysteine protease
MACMLVLMGLKIFRWGYSFESLVPQNSYRIHLHMDFTGNGEDLVVRTFLPMSNDRQLISEETIVAPNLNLSRDTTPMYVRGDWSRSRADGPYAIDLRYSAHLKAVEYDISPELRLPDKTPERLQEYVRPTNTVQVNDPLIVEKVRELTGNVTSLRMAVKRLYEYADGLGSKPFKGTTDALTALKLGEASCNGKSRLFIAMTRQLGLPSRLVGGLILTSGTKRTSHQWAEVYIGGYWVPFDTLNSHFAELPENYLALYWGDEVLFSHSRNIGFDYSFTIRKTSIANTRLTGFLDSQNWNFYNAAEGLLKRGFSLQILQFLLVIPFGVLFVVLFKNVIGLKTFGTFLPALMAMAVMETGILPGLLAFLIVLTVTVLMRYPLEKLGLLHTPKLAVMMIVVIFSLILVSALSQIWEVAGLSALNSATLFPIAILTITSERIALTISEEGLGETLSTLLQTMIVIIVCYLVMSSVALQTLVLAFPELLLGVLALNLWIGSWIGIRVMEFYRFRHILFGGPEA